MSKKFGQPRHLTLYRLLPAAGKASLYTEPLQYNKFMVYVRFPLAELDLVTGEDLPLLAAAYLLQESRSPRWSFINREPVTFGDVFTLDNGDCYQLTTAAGRWDSPHWCEPVPGWPDYFITLPKVKPC